MLCLSIHTLSLCWGVAAPKMWWMLDSMNNVSQVWEGASLGMMIQMLYLRPLQHKPTTASDLRERSACITPVVSTGVRGPIFLTPVPDVKNCETALLGNH